MRNVKIQKYPFSVVPDQKGDPLAKIVIKMPKEAELLFLDDKGHVWAEHRVYNEGKMEDRRFIVISSLTNTGELNLPPSAKYFQSLQKDGIVYHVYAEAWDYRPPHSAVMD